MNKQKKILLSYTLCLGLMVIGWFFTLHYNRRVLIDNTIIGDLESKLLEKERFSLYVEFQGEIEDFKKEGIQKSLNSIFQNPKLSSPLTVFYDKKTEVIIGNSVKLLINCLTPPLKNVLNLVSPLEIQLNLLCNEEIKENTLKQLRSLITSFSSEITEEFYESSIDKIHIFDVFLMDFENIDEKTLKSLLLANFDKITGLLAWDRNKTHVYFKKVKTSDFESLEMKKPLKSFNLLQISENKLFYNRNRGFNQATEVFRLFLYTSPAYFLNENDEKSDYFQAEYDFFVFLPQNPEKALLDLASRILKEALSVTRFLSLKESFSNQMEISFKPNFLLEAYYLREKQLFIKKFANQVKILDKMQKDEDIGVALNSYNSLVDYTLLLRSLLELEDIKEFFIKAFLIPNINEIEDFILDTFPEDYLLGVYLPLLIPILFPIIRALLKEII